MSFKRKASLVVANSDNEGIDLSELRFVFSVTQNNLQTPNSCVVTVYNLSEQTIGLIRGAEYSRLILKAGYEDENYSKIFDGQIRQIRRGRENNTDSYVVFVASDFDAGYSQAFVNGTLAAGSKLKDSLEVVARSFLPFGAGRVGAVQVENGADDKTLPRGKVFFTPARDALNQISTDTNAQWSFHESGIELVGQNQYVNDQEAVLLTAKTGLVGVPEQTLNGVIFKALLNPNIKKDRLVKIDNKSINENFSISLEYARGDANAQEAMALLAPISADGIYKVLEVIHSGDTRGQEWYTDGICVALGGFVPDQLKKGNI